jgi:signal transduction histidine kinase
MVDGYFIANIIISILMLSLGGLVILKSSRDQLNRIFLWFCIVTSIWIVTNGISNNKSLSKDIILTANHLVLFFSTLALLLLASFTIYLTNNQPLLKWLKAIVGINLLIAFVTLTPLVIKDVVIQQYASAIDFGPLGFLYFLAIIANFLLVVASLYYGITRTKGQEKQRIVTVTWSFLMMLLIVIALNAVIPLVTGSFNLTNIGPLAVIILAAGISYSIIKHRLFDIRSFVVRAAGYFLTFFVLSLLYVIPTIILANIVLGAHLSKGTMLVLVVITLVTSMLFQPLRLSFNRFTNRIFFRDYYEPQDVIDRLSNLLTKSVDLEIIKKESAHILRKALKTSSVKYALNIDHDHPVPTHLLTLLSKQKNDVVLLDDLGLHHQADLHKLMEQESIAAAIKLRTRHEELGYILLGFKESGSLFTKLDVRLLNTVADEIAIGLQNALRFEEISKFNITLQEKIEAATKELRHANSKLRELDKSKDEFISMASHQLRTPLTVIKGYLSMLLEGDMGALKEEQKQNVQSAFEGAERMVYIIGDLLNVSRLQTGKFQIENKPTNLGEVVESEIKQLQDSTKNHNLTLNFEKPADCPALMLDEGKMRQVIMNFIDNAIYYTPSGGTITVNINVGDKNVELTVNDTGLGVPKSEQHHLFTKFYRAGNARKVRPDGTGLGLYMAKKVIVAQGGALIFKSTEGKGSTFGFSLPRQALEAKP